ncbi:MAG: glycosyltransferase [Lentisphaeria bacterium]
MRQKTFFTAYADLFVLPSYSENFGVVVVDALAHGVPVITTKGTPWKELLGSDATLHAGGRCGWWIDIGAEPLANALAEAMSMTDENRTALGENGRKLVAEKYTWTAVGKKLAQGYQEVLDKR